MSQKVKLTLKLTQWLIRRVDIWYYCFLCINGVFLLRLSTWLSHFHKLWLNPSFTPTAVGNRLVLPLGCWGSVYFPVDCSKKKKKKLQNTINVFEDRLSKSVSLSQFKRWPEPSLWQQSFNGPEVMFHLTLLKMKECRGRRIHSNLI